MGAIISLINTSNSVITGLSLILFIISFILLMVLTYLATGTIFGSTIPPSTGTSSSFINLLFLMLAWVICLPVSIVSFITYILLHTISSFIERFNIFVI